MDAKGLEGWHIGALKTKLFKDETTLDVILTEGDVYSSIIQPNRNVPG